MTDVTPQSTAQIADRYRAFASQQAAGTSPTFASWAIHVAAHPDLLALLAQLPDAKQQPNLVFAAARLHGATPGDTNSLHETLTNHWQTLRAIILTRSTQTNETARCAAALLALQYIDGPIALLEVGAAAGLCLLPDRYSYTFTDGTRLDPTDGPSSLSIPITLAPGIAAPARMPDIVWRAGLDLNPLDPRNPDDLAWLEALVWPEHQARRQRLTAAARIAAQTPMTLHVGDLLTDLPTLATTAPTTATLVISHSATLAYLTEQQRHEAVAVIARTSARHLSFEARGVDPTVPALASPTTPDTLFVAAIDGHPYALANGHGDRLHPSTH